LSLRANREKLNDLRERDGLTGRSHASPDPALQISEWGGELGGILV